MDEDEEMLALQKQFGAAMDAAAVSGIDEKVVVTATVMAAAERMLRGFPAADCATWLRGVAAHIETHGEALRRAMG